MAVTDSIFPETFDLGRGLFRQVHLFTQIFLFSIKHDPLISDSVNLVLNPLIHINLPKSI